MIYMGSKNRIAKELIPIITKDLKPDQYYVEPFVGGCNMIDKVNHILKIGADNNRYLIAMWKELQNGWIPPMKVSKEEYEDVKADYKINGSKFPDYLKGYVGFNCAFRGVEFTGYKGSYTKRDYIAEAYKNVIKQVPDIMGIDFYSESYDSLIIPNNSIIYCDPPYTNTSKYNKEEFNSAEFWQWCRDKVTEGHKVFVSEYNAPDDFICIWEKEISSNLGSSSKTAKEKLFVHKIQE